jgi:hypothetical protein
MGRRARRERVAGERYILAPDLVSVVVPSCVEFSQVKLTMLTALVVNCRCSMREDAR